MFVYLRLQTTFLKDFSKAKLLFSLTCCFVLSTLHPHLPNLSISILTLICVESNILKIKHQLFICRGKKKETVGNDVDCTSEKLGQFKTNTSGHPVRFLFKFTYNKKNITNNAEHHPDSFPFTISNGQFCFFFVAENESTFPFSLYKIKSLCHQCYIPL